MKHFKRILSIFIAVMLVFGIAIPAVHAAPGSHVNIVGVGGDEGIFEVFYSGAWHPLSVPYWRIQDRFALAFCLESDADSPHDEGYNQTAESAFANATVRNGIKAILLHGAPNDTGGLQAGQAWYATQTAIWVWMREQAGVGKPFYTQSTVRAAAGEQATFNFYLYLLDKARNNVQSLSFGISATPSTVTLTDNGAGQLVGTTTVNFTNLNGSYSIDSTKIPAGVGVYGNTMQHGDVITVMAPLSYAGQAINMQDVLIGHDTRVPANIFWYKPGSSNFQDMVVFDYAFQPVALGSISCTSTEQPKGTLKIYKKVSDNSSPAGFQFEVKSGAGALIGNYTTDGTGVITIPNLAAGQYTITEINIPAGFIVEGWNPVTLSVWSGETTGVDFVNIKQKGQITIRKSNANPGLGSHSLGGAEFDILTSSRVFVETITTGADGIARSSMLDLGDFILVERKAPYGFVRSSTEYSVRLSTIDPDLGHATASVDIANQPQAGVIRLTKTNVNPVMGSYSLQGAIFEIRNASGTLVDTITTDSSGKAQSKQLPVGAAYTVSEKTAPYGFVRNPNTFPVSISYAGQDVAISYGDVTVGEKPQVGRITVTKRDVVTGDVAQGDATLRGAAFEVYAEDKTTLVDTIYCA